MPRNRPVYVYRLVIEYPPGSDRWDWEPEGWVADTPYDGGDPDADYSFRWPENRLCLTRGTAKRRADLFRQYGATVTVERSERVTWPEASDAA